MVFYGYPKSIYFVFKIFWMVCVVGAIWNRVQSYASFICYLLNAEDINTCGIRILKVTKYIEIYWRTEVFSIEKIDLNWATVYISVYCENICISPFDLFNFIVNYLCLVCNRALIESYLGCWTRINKLNF